MQLGLCRVLAYAGAMTGSSVAGIVGAGAGIITSLSLLLGVMPAFMKMRREDRESRARIGAKLDVIHTLTNATLTASKEAEMRATQRELIMMREVTAMHIEAGRQPSDDWLAATGAVQRRLEDLQQEMRDRATQNRAANLQLEAERTRTA